jgi:hypothetical protein
MPIPQVSDNIQKESKIFRGHFLKASHFLRGTDTPPQHYPGTFILEPNLCLHAEQILLNLTNKRKAARKTASAANANSKFLYPY